MSLTPTTQKQAYGLFCRKLKSGELAGVDVLHAAFSAAWFISAELERERCLQQVTRIAQSVPAVRASLLWEAAEHIDYDAARLAQGLPAVIRDEQ